MSKKKFDINRYKTHSGERGSTESWREKAEALIGKTNRQESCLSVLGLVGIPTEVELKKAYRALIRKAHPDVGGSEQAAARINAAYEQALELFKKLTPEKKEAKKEPQTPTQTCVKNSHRKDTQLRPQPLLPIDEKDSERYLCDNAYCIQEKKDGKHILIRKTKETVIVANKQGLETTIPQLLIETVLILSDDDFVIDCELIDAKLYVFDLLELGAVNYRKQAYGKRYETLRKFITPIPNVLLVEAIFGTNEKQQYYKKMKSEKREGVVFKKIDSCFSIDRNEDMLKCKFWATLSAVVDEEKTGKASFISYVFDEKGNKFYIGNCTAIGKEMPQAGDVVEIRYLYAHSVANSKLIQPVYLGIRDDVDPKECKKEQIKWKV